MSFNNRPNRPIKTELFVKLVTENEIRNDTIKKFYTTFKNNAPEGILGSYSVQNESGQPEEVKLVHRITEDGSHEYEIPLYRNLTPTEICDITMHLTRTLNEGDFLFETSTFDEECCIEEDDNILYFEPELFEQFAETLSQRVHTKWMKERMEAGWRYGTKRSENEKTHPLVKSWEQLTEDEKAIDYNLPEFFVDLLEQYGYTILSKEELDGLLK